MKLIGLARIGNDPELRYTSSGTAVLQLSLAYSHGKEKATQWLNAALFGKRAESLANFLQKGQLIYAEVSDIHVDIFVGKDGKERVSLKGMVQDVGLTGRADESKKAPAQAQPESIADMTDDIPF
jgi:single-strand DNA-binding protein